MIAETTWKNDLPDGPARRWSESGKLVDERTYRSGKQEGAVRSWSDDGKLVGEWRFKTGLLDGEQRQWSGDGQLGSEEVRLEGRLLSRTDFGPNGSPISVEKREAEPGTYQWSVLAENGKPILDGVFRNWRPEGVWKRWSRSGTLLRTCKFENGVVTEDSAPGGPMLDYPQLMVSLRASARLEHAARSEKPEVVRRSLPFVIAGGLSLAAGFVHDSGSATAPGILSIVGGVIGVVGGIVTAAVPYSEPYSFARGWNDVRDLPTSTHEAELSREFQAEGRLLRTAGVAKVNDVLIAGTLGAFNVWTLVDGIRNSNTATTALSAGAILVGLVPLVLPISERSMHVDLIRDQQKLFSPAVAIGLTGGNLTWRF